MDQEVKISGVNCFNIVTRNPNDLCMNTHMQTQWPTFYLQNLIQYVCW